MAATAIVKEIFNTSSINHHAGGLPLPLSITIDLLRVVDLDQLNLNVEVHESRIALVRTGQPVVIRVDALPQRKFSGKVLKINPTPVTPSWPNTDLKEYVVVVSIIDPPKSLRLGLTALVEIDVSKPTAP